MNIAGENQKIGQLEALEWAYEVALSHDENKTAGSMEEAIKLLNQNHQLDFPALAADLAKVRFILSLCR